MASGLIGPRGLHAPRRVAEVWYRAAGTAPILHPWGVGRNVKETTATQHKTVLGPAPVSHKLLQSNPTIVFYRSILDSLYFPFSM